MRHALPPPARAAARLTAIRRAAPAPTARGATAARGARFATILAALAAASAPSCAASGTGAGPPPAPPAESEAAAEYCVRDEPTGAITCTDPAPAPALGDAPAPIDRASPAPALPRRRAAERAPRRRTSTSMR
jgi:hypothetical protein